MTTRSHPRSTSKQLAITKGGSHATLCSLKVEDQSTSHELENDKGLISRDLLFLLTSPARIQSTSMANKKNASCTEIRTNLKTRAFVVAVAVCWATRTNAFLLSPAFPRHHWGHDRLPSCYRYAPACQLRNQRLFEPLKTTRLYAELPDIQSMRVGAIRQELESYGISTKSFLEKKEMIEALEKARAEGKTPINSGNRDVADGVNGDRTSASKASSTSSSTTSSRESRIKEEMAKAGSMKVSDLKAELQARGISTKSFFEKSEFVKAYAEAVVDGVKGKGGGSAAPDAPLDPEYRDVVMQKMNRADPRMLQGTIIDVTSKR